MKFLNKNNQSGFSLVEILIAGSILILGSAITMKTVDYIGQQSAKRESQADIEQFLFSMDNYLSRKDICTQQFLGKGINQPIQSIKDPANELAVFEVGGSYLDDKILIRGMQLIKLSDESIPTLRVILRRRDSRNKPYYQYVRNIPMIHELNAAQTQIEKCYEASSLDIDIKDLLAQRMCGVTPANPNGTNGIYDPINKTCSFRGILDTPQCPEGEVVVGINYNEVLDYTPICGKIHADTQCPTSWARSINDQGQILCLEMTNIINQDNVIMSDLTPNCSLLVDANKIKLACVP